MGATEIVVDVTTNACQSLHYTDIWVNGQHVTQAQTPACPSDPFATVDLGTFTVLPSHGPSGDVKLVLVGNVSTAGDFTNRCVSPDTTDLQCIVARRSIAFNPHQRIDLPVFLDNACTGFQCPDNATCVVDETGPHCGDSTCGSNNGPVCIGDGGVADVIVPDAFTLDVNPPACPPVVPANKGNPTFFWSFDAATVNTVNESSNAFSEPLTGASIVSTPPTFCDNPYLASTGGQKLASSGNTKFSMFTTKSFIAGLAFHASGDAPVLSLAGSSTQSAGFDISIVNGAMQVSFGGVTAYRDTVPIKLAIWHRFAIEVATITNGTGTDASTITVYLDGAPATTIPTPIAYGPGTPIAFSVGPVDVDDVSFYQK